MNEDDKINNIELERKEFTATLPVELLEWIDEQEEGRDKFIEYAVLEIMAMG